MVGGVKRKTLAQERISKGLCPRDGKEAAPYYLCYDCRQRIRFDRALKGGLKHQVFTVLGSGKGALWGLPADKDTPEFEARFKKTTRWSTPVNLPASDKRGHPRLQKIRVDVEATLISVIVKIGRPSSIEEILEAWGRLRENRVSPLPDDLARIIKAADRRTARLAKRAKHRDRTTPDRVDAP